jgi:hypothetical protein
MVLAARQVRGEGEELRSAFAQREKRRMEARNELEEEMFVRIPLSKVEKKRQAAQHRQVGALTQLAHLGDEVADLVSNADAFGCVLPAHTAQHTPSHSPDDVPGPRSRPVHVSSCWALRKRNSRYGRVGPCSLHTCGACETTIQCLHRASLSSGCADTHSLSLAFAVSDILSLWRHVW